MKYFEAETYAGKPSIGSAEIGQEIVDVLARKATDTLSDLWTRKIPPADCHSPVWPLKWADLSLQDPFYVLPVLMGVTMFIQQNLSGSHTAQLSNMSFGNC